MGSLRRAIEQKKKQKGQKRNEKAFKKFGVFSSRMQATKKGNSALIKFYLNQA